MSTDANDDAVYVLDPLTQFQPIRLSGESFLALHDRMEESLEAFLSEHLDRFPQQARGTGRVR